ncbi:MAG: aldehyde dehydrogenase family protein, partial [Euryarchaeota archaeon]|nr:aldehyde dehydrogenase family protein [Euryarchaeota archaeon]
MLVDGEWIESVSGKTFPVIDPGNGEKIDDVPLGTREDAKHAVEVAQKKFSVIADMTAHQRSRILVKTAHLIDGKKDEIAKLIAREAGKVYKDAIFEIKRAINVFIFSAEEAKRVNGESLRADASEIPAGNEKRIVFTVREPVGVVAAISPFNFPLLLLSHKVAPAIAAGNAVVAKPSTSTPLTALKLGELMLSAGLPNGVFNVVTGPGSTVGAELVENPNTNIISFTGEVVTGIQIAQNASKHRPKKVILEMGGMDPLIICDDANIEEAVNAAVSGVYYNAGQVCTATKRIIVFNKISEVFIKKLIERVKNLKVGYQLEPETDVGPLINAQAIEKVNNLVKDAVENGAKLLVGGRRLKEGGYQKGSYYAPTVLDYVQPSMRIAQEEIFGPVAPLFRVDNIEQAIEVANSTKYGLQGAIYTSNLKYAFQAARKIKAGGFMINDPTNFRAD